MKVFGNVESGLFQLHRAYDAFNEAMFTEFRNKGLQTQYATPVVEKLEMYDSFHASECAGNRQVFLNYLHATRNISRSEWLADRMAPAVQALLRRFEHTEMPNLANSAVDEVFKKWPNPETLKPKAPKP